jgi:uncharacterized delta-60 repeat protein
MLGSGGLKRLFRAKRCVPGLESLEDRCLLSAGDLDPTFGAGGLVRGRLAESYAQTAAALVQPDGKVLLAGDQGGTDRDFVLVRLGLDGSPDPTFGDGGRVVTDFGETDVPSAIALGPDGSIVVVGVAAREGFFHLAVARYTPDGQPDARFGDGGRVVGARADVDTPAVAVQPDGRILVVSSVYFNEPRPGRADLTLTRFTADGGLDLGFGNGGTVTPEGLTRVGEGDAVAVQPDGKIVVVGGSPQPDPENRFLSDYYVGRFNADGSPDEDFGVGGRVNVDFGGGIDHAVSVVVQADGRLVVVGNGLPSIAPFVDTIYPLDYVTLARLNPDGRLDAAFGDDGKVSTTLGGGGQAQAVALQEDGGLILVAKVLRHREASLAVRREGEVGVVRYDSHGAVDETYPVGSAFPDSAFALIHDVAVLADGRVVAAGAGYTVDPDHPGNAATPEFFVARFLDSSQQQIAYLDQLYADLLGRTIEPAGLAHWQAVLDRPDAADPRGDVVRGILAGPEYRTRLIDTLYREVLDRAAEAGGLGACLSFLEGGHTAEELRAEILGSDEYLAGHADDFVGAVYQDVLRRTPDAAGRPAWEEALAQGRTRAEVTLAILRSRETQTLVVRDLYEGLLDRPADDAGLAAFAEALQAGVTEVDVRAAVAASAEYFRLA